MSEQSPWGTPPPPSGGAGGPYPPPPAESPPGPPPGGWAPPAYGAGPPGPPPKRNTAAVIAIVVGALVVIAAVVVTLVVTGSDDDADTAGTGASASTSASDPTSEATPEPSDDPTDDQSGDTGSDSDSEDTVTGDGYAFQLPGIGWQNALDEAQSSGLGSTLDAIIILGTSLDLAQSNILVEALTAGGAPSLEALEGQWKRNLGGSDGAVPDDIPDITIDGERAIGVRFTDRQNVNGLFIDQVAYLALHNGNQYSVALSLPSDNDSVSEADFEKVLDSWTWTY